MVDVWIFLGICAVCVIAYFRFLMVRVQNEKETLATAEAWGLKPVTQPEGSNTPVWAGTVRGFQVTVGWLPQGTHPKHPEWRTDGSLNPTVVVRYALPVEQQGSFCAFRRPSADRRGLKSGDTRWDSLCRVEAIEGDEERVQKIFSRPHVRLAVELALRGWHRLTIVTENEVRIRFYDGHKPPLKSLWSHLLDALFVACALTQQGPVSILGCDACVAGHRHLFIEDGNPNAAELLTCDKCNTRVRRPVDNSSDAHTFLRLLPGAYQRAQSWVVEEVDLFEEIRVRRDGKNHRYRYRSPTEKAELLEALRDQGCSFVFGSSGWPPASVMEELRDRGHIKGPFISRIDFGDGATRATEYQVI